MSYSKPSFYFLIGLIPILIWSFTATVVKSFSLQEEGFSVAFYSIIFASIFSFIFTLYKDKKYFNQNIKILKTTPKVLVLIFITGIFICGHYFSIYYIFSTDYVVQGNIINYMWPLFSFILSKTITNKNTKYSKSSDSLFVFMAFIGAVFIVSGDELSLNFINHPTLLSISIFSALSAAIYFALSNKIKDYLQGNFIHFSLPLLSTLFILLLIFFIYPEIAIVRKEVIYLGLVLGLFSIFIGNTAWTITSYITKSHAFSSIAYFVPVFSTAAILYYNNEPYNNYLLTGLILIVISNILIHFSKEIVHTVNICFAIIILYSGVSFLVAPLSEAKQNSIVNIIATIFTFFAAFLLNRVWNQKKDEELILFDLLIDFNKFIKMLEIPKQEKEYILNDFKDKLIEKNDAFTIQHYLTTLYNQYDSKIPESIFSLMRKLYQIQTSSISFPEFLIITMLSSVSAVYVILYRDYTLMGNLMSVIFASSVSYITYILYDFDKQGFLNKNKILTIIENVNFLDYNFINKKPKQILPNLLSFLLIICIIIIAYFIIMKYLTLA